jgi:hypothetical protein
MQQQNTSRRCDAMRFDEVKRGDDGNAACGAVRSPFVKRSPSVRAHLHERARFPSEENVSLRGTCTVLVQVHLLPGFPG